MCLGLATISYALIMLPLTLGIDFGSQSILKELIVKANVVKKNLDDCVIIDKMEKAMELDIVAVSVNQTMARDISNFYILQNQHL